jgi:multidrug efflux pump subunit AcrA (membrane-fusion protein)
MLPSEGSRATLHTKPLRSTSSVLSRRRRWPVASSCTRPKPGLVVRLAGSTIPNEPTHTVSPSAAIQEVAANTPIATLRNEQLLRDWRSRSGERQVAERAALAAEAQGDRSSASLARLRYAEAREAETLLARELERATVRAPVAGVVLTQRLREREGDYVEAGDTIAWIGNRDSVELEMLVHQEDLGRVHTGARVIAKTSAHPNQRLSGHVFAIAPAATLVNGEPMYAVRARLDNREQLLRPGMSAFGKISSGWRPIAGVVFRRPWRWLRMHLWW